MTAASHHRVVPLIDHRHAALPTPALGAQPPSLVPARDSLHRPLRDLRISVTDRCNFRCSYCMPKEVFDKDYAFLPQSSLLSFEEITRIARQFARLGTQKIRLTGGEPLLRKNIEVLIEQLATVRDTQGKPLDISLTTNGSLLARKAYALKAAGLQRISVSLDALDDTVFRRMNDVNFPVADVLAGIAAAQAAGLGPIKVNMVVKRGTNDHEIIPMARHFRGTGVVLRFIEYMDVGATNGWRMDEVLPSADIIARLQAEFGLVALDPTRPGETAQRWGYAGPDGKHLAAAGEIGVISSVTQAFCQDCTRARLSTEGKLYLCLFASQGHDLRSLVRANASDADLSNVIAQIWAGRTDRYSALRTAHASPTESNARRVEMSYIGG
jgi:GTP 3',8-cyclase